MKGFIDYKDFCNLSEERRLGIDPASKMLDDYQKFGDEEMAARNFGNKARSPSQREQTRLKKK